MRAEGLTINAVTIQNEPEHGGNNPSMLMTSVEQNEFIKNHLGPAFKKAGITTEIVIWDHNALITFIGRLPTQKLQVLTTDRMRKHD
jgi:glucosylceramidase